MAEDSEKVCDPEDIICQMQVLTHLKGLQNALGEDRFKADFPELQGIGERLKKQEASIREALEKCGLEPLQEAEVETPEQE